MWVTTRPISSMWPISASRGPPAVPGTRATDDPSVSLETAAKAAAASRHTVAGAPSWPEGPGALSSPRRTSGIATSVREQLAEHVGQDSAVAEVLGLLGGVDAHPAGELDVVGAHPELAGPAAVEAGDLEGLASREPERVHRVAGGELEGHHAHPHEV